MIQIRKTHLFFLLLGFVSIISQTIILRELLIEVNGNEIVFSIYLSLWLALIALGSLIAGKFLQKANLLLITQISFFCLSALIPIQFLSIRLLINHLTVISGQLINIPVLFILAFIVLAPGCLILGFLFPILCKQLKNTKQPVHTGYIFECIGVIIGGIVFVICISFLSHFTILILLSAKILILLTINSKKKIILIPIIIYIVLAFLSESFFNNHYASRYIPQKLLFSKDSKFGRLDVTQDKQQKNYYWNGELFANTQNDMLSQQMVNFVMLQHPHPKKILLIGGLLNGYIEEILEYDSVDCIDYIELEINILKQSKQLKNPKINFIKADALHYLKKSKKTYDIIFVDLPDPSSLNLNRYYTLDFFSLLKTHILSDSSISAITVQSGTNFMTKEITIMNASIYNTFQKVFHNVILVPSLKNIYIGSDGNYISNDIETLYKRMKDKDKTWFNEVVIFEKCNKLRVNQILSAIKSQESQINRISKPVAYLSTIMLWTRLLNLKAGKSVEWIQDNIIITCIGLLILILLFSFSATILSHSYSFKTDFSIFSVSLVNFVMQLILLNLFQMHFGIVYLLIFLFTTTFIAGLTSGFLLGKNSKLPLYSLFIFNIVFSLFLFIIFETNLPVWVYFLMNFTFAFIEGMILSNLLNIKYRKEKIKSSSSFYFIDCIGATFGGIIFSIVMFPVLGLKLNIILLIILLSLNSVVVFKKQQ